MATEVKRDIPTPDNWHWAITPQQVTEIKQGNRDTINKVYFDNLQKFKHIAANYCRLRNTMQFFDDFLQQIYIDLPEYCFDDVRTFYCGLVKSYFRVFGITPHKCIDMRTCLSFDALIFGFDDVTLGDTIQAPPDLDEAEFDEQNKRVIEIIETQPQLTEVQKDYLTAVAFGCYFRRGLYGELCNVYK